MTLRTWGKVASRQFPCFIQPESIAGATAGLPSGHRALPRKTILFGAIDRLEFVREGTEHCPVTLSESPA